VFTKIVKRDGRVVDFDSQKITNAIRKAGEATGEFGEEVAKRLTLRVLNLAQQTIIGRTPTVEEIQDIVEEVLLSSPYKKTAKAYILYRDQHAKIREIVSRADVTLVDRYLERLDWQVNENSNMTYSLQGLNNYISSEISKVYWLNKIYPPEIRRAHTEGDFHIHDLNILSVYCVGWDLQGLLLDGFRGAPGKVESKPARHFRSALGQVVNFFYTLQGEAAGAQAFSNFDTFLAPFIRYDGLDYTEVKQALQEFIFNINVPTRVGFQTPFTNLTLDLKVPEMYANSPVIIGGEFQKATYGEFQKEMDMLNRAFLEVLMEGDAKGRVFTFPIPTYNITKDFDWDDPKLELLWKVTAKYGIPYFSNFINSDMNPEDARSMCLFPEETLLYRFDGKIRKTTIGEFYEAFCGEKLDEEWSVCKPGVEALSLNPNTGKLEWVPVRRLLRTCGRNLVTIRTKDGKTMRVSPEHPVAVFTEQGITFRRADQIGEGDFLLVLKDASSVLGDEAVDPEFAWFMGLFVADGNYLYDSRYPGQRVRGIQITFNTQDREVIERARCFVSKHLGYEMKFTKDSRYERSLRGYVYNSEFARRLREEYDLCKYERLPAWVWNASRETILAFLQGFFDGDGYKDGQEIHINDEPLSRELNLLMQLVGISTTYRTRERSQVIRVQHTLGRGANGSRVIRDSLHNSIPTFLLDCKYRRDASGRMLYQCYGCRTVGLATLDRWELSSEKVEALRDADFAVVPVETVLKETLDKEQTFYDIELERNHYFVHSDGNITHNCCRLRLDLRKLEKRGGGLFGANPMTGSVGVVTINMPRLGYLAKDENDFLERLGALMNLAKESLEIKRKVLERFTEKDLYPYSKFYLRGVKERFGQYWKNHFSTIGLVGMNEACLNLLGVNIASEEGRRFALKVLDFMREKLLEFQEETGNNYNLEATPAEGTSYRLARIDKEKYPDIICANEEEYRKGAKPFYTNSSQLPVNYTDDVFEALDLQDELQTKYTGGTVLHIFVGEQISNPESVKNLIRKICENYRLPYFTITPTFSVCPSHGYIAGECETCPTCGARCEVYSRVVGYLRPVNQWNEGKREEFKLRKTFRIA